MELLDIKQASGKLRIAPITLRRRIRAGEIPHRKLGGRIFFTIKDLETYLEAAAVPAKSAKEARHA